MVNFSSKIKGSFNKWGIYPGFTLYVTTTYILRPRKVGRVDREKSDSNR